MNESIGAKGVGRDYRRTLIIKQKEKEKLKEYQEKQKLKKLEQDVRKKQIFTLIKTLPIAITYETIKDILPIRTKKEKEEKTQIIEENREQKKERNEYVVVTIILEDGTKKIIKVPKNKIEEKTNEIINEPKEEKQNVEEKKEPIIEEEKIQLEQKKKEEERKKYIKPKGIGEEQEEIKPKEEKKEPKKDEFSELTSTQKEKLDRIKARKIIDVYERQLKDIRYDLRQLIFEYNVLVQESENIVESKEAQRILDRLTIIIEKLEQLKTKINIDNLDKYDDNYIYTLIEDYLEEFKDKKVISEIKDSKLYILISEKLAELDKEKDKLKHDVEDKKASLEMKEEVLDELKEKYYKIDKVNQDLADFQYQQEIILREMRRKIDEATTVREKTEVKIEGMNRQTRSMLRRLTLAMMFPGVRPAAAMAATTAMYLQFMRDIINPRTVTKKYKVIEVYDYSRSIEANLKEIDKASSMLNKTEKDIDKILEQIKYDFKEYIGVIKECDELISNLETIKSELKEKEYEINKIKSKEEKELERNNAKVLTMGEYPM